MTGTKQFLFALCCLFAFAGTSYAQNESPEVHKKIVIVKKTVDENGNVNEETTILEGEDAENFDMDNLPEMEEGAHEFNIDVEITETEGENFRWVEEGNTEMNINGEQFIFSDDMESLDDLPEEIKAKLKAHNINIEELSDGKEKRIMMFKSMDDNDNKAFLGVMIDESQNLKTGIKISEVVKESAAEKAGLKAGDVLTKLDGNAINSYEDLVEALSGKEVGTEVNLEYKRGATVQTTKAKLAERKMQMRHFDKGDWENKSPEDWFMMKKKSDNCGDWGNKSCCPSKGQKSNKPFLGVYLSDEKAKGALIDGAVKGSAAESLGMQKGDVITKVNKAKIGSSIDLQNAIQTYKPGDNVKVTFMRNGSKERATAVLGASEKSNCCGSSCGGDKAKGKKEKKSITIIKENGESTTIERREENLKPADRRLEVQSMELFPNPNKGTFKINFETESLAPTTITILNINGKEVYREEIEDFKGAYSKELNITRFAKGTYLLNIIQGERIFTEKIIYN